MKREWNGSQTAVLIVPSFSSCKDCGREDEWLERNHVGVGESRCD
jgi:hypothetical protein